MAIPDRFKYLTLSGAVPDGVCRRVRIVEPFDDGEIVADRSTSV
ncbi:MULTISPECIES: hypothetical protein [Halomicrobium]|nr:MULTISPECIES: hypothetical protein [Halomicrobium]